MRVCQWANKSGVRKMRLTLLFHMPLCTQDNSSIPFIVKLVFLYETKHDSDAMIISYPLPD
jgi:hypothetical protein